MFVLKLTLCSKNSLLLVLLGELLSSLNSLNLRKCFIKKKELFQMTCNTRGFPYASPESTHTMTETN
jgi:hypothetical protein